MTTPWPPPAEPASATAEQPWRRPAPWAAWTAVLLLLAGSALSVPAIGNLMTWASGELGGDRSLELNAGDLVNRGGAGYATTLVAAYLGLLLAAALGLVAAPVSAGARWAVGGLFTALAALLIGATAADSSEDSGETLVIALVVTVPPLLVLLLLLARGARRGAAATALLCAVVATVAQFVTLVRLAVAPADVGPGVWVVAGAVLVGLAGAVLLVRAVRPL
ncbi:hypothetical protein [Blastococcus sp. TF02A-26]|uniref:hypothetical protein n=1 Tax=Blastococcus sp. TF02A-26 TaxID=2250577 RepID=UPI000DE8E0DC|nr:hypothetical protein [Blastococcus sp. TF02A-26]RBY82622.1 hypothetical protein DQ240_18105 [Blastococcus sp. TF02A-26]